MLMLKELNLKSKSQKLIRLSMANTYETKTLEYTYRKDYKYYIKPSYVPSADECKEPDTELFDILDKLRLREVSGNKARSLVSEYAKKNPLILKILHRNLGVGVSTKLINQAIPNLIPEFNIQKAKDFNFSRLLKNKQYIAEIKYDGARLITVVKDREIRYFLSSGREVKIPFLTENIKNILLPGVYDGELVFNEGRNEDRLALSSLITSSNKDGVIRSENIAYAIFDMLSIEDWLNKVCSTPLKDRKRLMTEKIPDIRLGSKIILTQVRGVSINREDTNFIGRMYDSVRENGHEGLIIKEIDSYYSFKRDYSWMKMKDVKEADLKVVAIVEGEGKYENLIGSLLCEGRVEGEKVRVKVSGMADCVRQLKEEVLDRVIEVRYNGLIRNKQTGEYSLYLPRFIRFRDDK